MGIVNVEIRLGLGQSRELTANTGAERKAVEGVLISTVGLGK